MQTHFIIYYIYLEFRSMGRDLDVKLEDKTGEDYVPPPAPAYVAFSGIYKNSYLFADMNNFVIYVI